MSSSSTKSTSSSNTNNSPTIQSLQGPNDALPYIKQFEKLSSGTEMGGYKEPQWRFLLSGADVVTAAIIQSSDDKNKEDDDSSISMKLGGSACKVSIDENTYGLGMVLVDPTNRGKGYAKALINTSMGRVSNDDNNKETKYILANCNEMGAPVYRKLGFKDCGTNSFLSCSVSDIMNTISVDNINDDDKVRTVSNGKYTNEQLSLLTTLDAKATGLKRKERIELLAKGDYAKQYGSCSTLVFIGNDTVGIARQDCTNGPLWIGPIIGDEKKVIPLLKALIEKHFANNQDNKEKYEELKCMMLIVDHPNLVESLLSSIKGMKNDWVNPSMSQDGESVYMNGDGSYLSMLHPTLG